MFLPTLEAVTVLKVVDGRVDKVAPGESKLVLSYRHPVSLQEEKLILKVDKETGFTKGVRFEDLQKGEPLSVDYDEDSDGMARAILIRRVQTRGAPDGVSR